MKVRDLRFVVFLICISSLNLIGQSEPPSNTSDGIGFGQLPCIFESNKGQAARPEHFRTESQRRKSVVLVNSEGSTGVVKS